MMKAKKCLMVLIPSILGLQALAWSAITPGTTWSLQTGIKGGTNPFGDWSFMYVDNQDTTFDVANYSYLTTYAPAPTYKWSESTGARVGADGIANSSLTNDLALVWTAPDSGYVQFVGSALYGQVATTGNQKIYLDIPGLERQTQIVGGSAGGYSTTYNWDFNNIHVAAGDHIVFRLNANGSATYDQVYWKNGTVWNIPKVVGVAAPLLPGDANGDNAVNVVDLGILATNYGAIGTATWAMGDFNSDTNVNVVDLGILATNYGQTGGQVPEPLSLGLLGVGMAIFARKR